MWADIEDVVVARIRDYFTPGSCRAGQQPSDMSGLYPFCAVRRVAGPDDFVTDYPSVDLDFFDQAGNYTSLSTLARRVHHERMGRAWTNKPADAVTLLSGEVVRIDRCITAQAPQIEDYEDDSVVRIVARYRFENRAQTAA
jgi:hypothetical protein